MDCRTVITVIECPYLACCIPSVFLWSLSRPRDSSHSCTTLADTDGARDLLAEGERLSARDAVHVAVMRSHEVEWIATFDRGFDGVPGLRRLELG